VDFTASSFNAYITCKLKHAPIVETARLLDETYMTTQTPGETVNFRISLLLDKTDANIYLFFSSENS